MTSTKLIGKNYAIPLEKILARAGYKKQKNGWMKEDRGQGRFHANILSRDVADLHFDTYIEGRHVVFDLPITLSRERNRIYRISRPYRKYDLSPEQFKKILYDYF